MPDAGPGTWDLELGTLSACWQSGRRCWDTMKSRRKIFAYVLAAFAIAAVVGFLMYKPLDPGIGELSWKVRIEVAGKNGIGCLSGWKGDIRRK